MISDTVKKWGEELERVRKQNAWQPIYPAYFTSEEEEKVDCYKKYEN